MSIKASKMNQITKKEVGYLEKKSNKNLDSKKANAGNNNYTKYWRDISPSLQGSFWCACFITWCLVQSFGKTVAQKLLLGSYPFLACQELYDVFKSKGRVHDKPEVGDIVVFWSYGQKRFYHTGYVWKVTSNEFFTREGNSGNSKEVTPNGGGVNSKSYSISSAIIAGHKFLRPDYSDKLTVKTKKNNLGCYAKCDLKSKKLGSFKKGTVVAVVKCVSGNWYKVKGKAASGKTIAGYSREKFLS